MSKASQRRASAAANKQPPKQIGTRFTRAHFWTLIRMAFGVLLKGEIYVQIKRENKNGNAS